MIKIAVLGITGILLALFLKETRPVFAVLISMASCMLIFFCAVEKLRYLSESLQQLQSYTNIKDTYVKILFKMIGITYVADFAAGICKDAGYGAISSQIEFFGKISVLATGTPVLLHSGLRRREPRPQGAGGEPHLENLTKEKNDGLSGNCPRPAILPQL